MKIIKFLLQFFLVLIVLLFIAAAVYVRIYGKNLLEGALKTALKRDVVIGQASYHFPFGLQAGNVRVARSPGGEDFLKVKKIFAQISPNTVYQGKFAFDEVALIEPSLVIAGKKDLKEVSEEQAPAQGGAAAPVRPGHSQEKEGPAVAEDQDARIPAEVSVRRLIVQQGKLQYAEGLTQKGFSFKLEDVDLKAEDLVFPVKGGRSAFRISARLIKEGNPLSGSNVEASGWVDVVKKDMEAALKVIEANGTVGLTAEAVSENNDMEVTGQIKMRNLFGGIGQQVSPEASSVNDLVLNALSSAGVEIGAEFAFKTKMDNFRVGQVSFSGNVVTK